jgi:hypothetical protein
MDEDEVGGVCAGLEAARTLSARWRRRSQVTPGTLGGLGASSG